jgi:hypothetical protein
VKQLFAFSLLLGTFALAAPAQADPNGVWWGQLAFTSSDGDDETFDCTIGIARAGNRLYVDDSDGCTYTPDFVTAFVIVNGNELEYEGIRLGTLEADRVVFEYAEGDDAWYLELKPDADGNLAVRETMKGKDDYSDLTEGTLAPSDSLKRRAARSEMKKARGLARIWNRALR